MAEVDDHFGEAGFQVLHRLEIKILPTVLEIRILPFVCENGGIGHDQRIENDVPVR